MGIRHTPKPGEVILSSPRKKRKDVLPEPLSKLSNFFSIPRSPKKVFTFDRKHRHSSDSIPEENFFGTFSRYRRIVHNKADDFYGVDFTGKPLGNNSLIGKFIRYRLGKPSRIVNKFVGGTLPLSDALQQTWDQKNPGPPYRSGGPFFSAEMHLPHSQNSPYLNVSNLGYPSVTSDERATYQGYVIDNGFWDTDTLSNYRTGKPSARVLTAYHTLAWDKLKPQIAKANVGQFIYELKDLPHMLRTTSEGFAHAWEQDATRIRDSVGSKFNKSVEFMQPRNAADHFLNHQFGWVPFVSDLQSMIHVYFESRDLLIRTVKENGRWVRKRRVLETTDDDTLVNHYDTPSCIPGQSDFIVNGQGYQSDQNIMDFRIVNGSLSGGATDIRIRETKTVWAVGSFRFYRPEFDDNLIGFESQLVNIQRLLTLYGARINPTTLWKITPWSWLVDWFVHLGDFIAHWDDYVNDGIVAKYLYVCQTYRRDVTKTVQFYFKSGTFAHSWQRSFVSKRREPADSPYGFNRPWSSITPSQWAILGAIGIGRTPNSRIRTGL